MARNAGPSTLTVPAPLRSKSDSAAAEQIERLLHRRVNGTGGSCSISRPLLLRVISNDSDPVHDVR